MHILPRQRCHAPLSELPIIALYLRLLLQAHGIHGTQLLLIALHTLFLLAGAAAGAEQACCLVLRKIRQTAQQRPHLR
jgi:hypothetical protein